MAVPNEYTDLDSLNTYIGRHVRKQEDKSVALSGGWDEFSSIEDKFGIELERISTSGNKNDCLIHAFLTSTCPNFRCLDTDVKNRIADKYRRNGLEYIVTGMDSFRRKTEKEQNDIITRIGSRNFLTDAELSLICQYYTIKVMVFETLRTHVSEDKASSIIYGEKFGRNTDEDEVFMFYNPGNYHFESVRVANTEEYTIPFSFATMINTHLFNDSISVAEPAIPRPPISVAKSTPINVAEPAIPRTPISVANRTKPAISRKLTDEELKKKFEGVSTEELERRIAEKKLRKKRGGSYTKRKNIRKRRKTRRA